MGAMLRGLVGSRKWAVGLGTILVLAFNRKLGLGLSIEEVIAIAGLVGVMIAGEAYRDGKAAANGEPPGLPPTGGIQQGRPPEGPPAGI